MLRPPLPLVSAARSLHLIHPNPHGPLLSHPSGPKPRGVCSRPLHPAARPARPSRLTRRLRCSTARERSEGASAKEADRRTPEEASVAEVHGAGSGQEMVEEEDFTVGMGNPAVPVPIWRYRMSLGDQAFFLLSFIACTTTVAFTSLVIATIPTLNAMRRAAISLARLADTAREELPSTMAAIRLSGMELSDLTLELSDLSQEIIDGVSKSAQAVQGAEAGIRRIGALARQQTMSMIEERANLPDISLRPVVSGAARKTSHVVSQAKKTIMNFISGGESISDSDGRLSDRVES